MKIVCYEIEESEAGTLQAHLGKDCLLVKEKLTSENAKLYASAHIISCFIYSQLDKATLETFRDLKLIATRSTGYDHIDLEYCNERGIAVVNVPAYGEHTVAEHVFALLLCLSRHMPQAVSQTKVGDFSMQDLKGFDLCGKTLGLIGTGRIGLHAALIAKGFGMNVLAYDITPDEAAAQRIGFAYVPFETLLAKADVISLHVPGTIQTRHMLSDKEFSMMKDGVVVINTARGIVLDVKALLCALTSGKVSGAGLDVLPEEPAIREEAELLRGSFTKTHNLETLLVDHALLHHKNVIVTPHSAFYTREAVEKILQTTIDNIQSFMNGSVRNLVNKPFGVHRT